MGRRVTATLLRFPASKGRGLKAMERDETEAAKKRDMASWRDRLGFVVLGLSLVLTVLWGGMLVAAAVWAVLWLVRFG